MESGCRRVLRACSTRAGESFCFLSFDRRGRGIPLTHPSRSMISYPNYKFIFPIKALGMFARKFGNPQIDP